MFSLTILFGLEGLEGLHSHVLSASSFGAATDIFAMHGAMVLSQGQLGDWTALEARIGRRDG